VLFQHKDTLHDTMLDLEILFNDTVTSLTDACTSAATIPVSNFMLPVLCGTFLDSYITSYLLIYISKLFTSM